MKVDLHLTEPVNVIGGLVGAVRQCRYRFQRERTAEGLWFTKPVNWHLEGRQLFTSKIIDYDETRENVRPFITTLPGASVTPFSARSQYSSTGTSMIVKSRFMSSRTKP